MYCTKDEQLRKYEKLLFFLVKSNNNIYYRTMGRPLGSKSNFRTPRPPKKPKPSGNPTGHPKIYTKEVIEQLAESLEKWLNEDDDNVFINRWCKLEKVRDDYIEEWAKENPRFYQAYRLYKKRQENRIFEGAMFKKYSENITKFALSCNHGWVDKTNIELSTSEENPFRCVLELEARSTKDLVEDTGDSAPAS